jgi:hypothetical protein
VSYKPFDLGDSDGSKLFRQNGQIGFADIPSADLNRLQFGSVAQRINLRAPLSLSIRAFSRRVELFRQAYRFVIRFTFRRPGQFYRSISPMPEPGQRETV